MKAWTVSAIAVALFAVPAGAATRTSSGQVAAMVIPNCQISGASNIVFGDYDPLSVADTTASGSASVRCTRTVSYKTFITGTRSFTIGADSLNFTLWRDAGHTVPFEPDNTGSFATSVSNAPVTIDYYGLLAAGQDVAAGSATSSLTFNVEF